MNLVLVAFRNFGITRGKRAAQLFCAIFASLALCLPALPQGSSGRILGTITDQTGGVVSGATVTVIDTARGTTRTLTTDDAGQYNAPNLTPGDYTVEAEAKGFKKISRQGLTIQVGQEVRVDLTLQPGEQSQTVTVTESVPLVETTNATQGGTLQNSDIVDLPLNGRDYQSLMGLRPGVMLQPGGGPWTQSTNGVRPDQSVWMVEGVINANFFDARPVVGMASPFTDGATILPVDAIQEFNLMENPKAEYGWKPGAVVNVGVKSGTNTLHGDAYAFGRTSAWDARNYFNVANPISGCPIIVSGQCQQTPAQLTQFGAVVGGPIKKDKLFFFGGYEGLRSNIGFDAGIAAPATASLGGDPTHSMVDAIKALNASGIKPSPVSMNLAGCTNGATPVCTGNIFPNTGTVPSFLSTFPTVNTSNNGVGKLDYHPNDKNAFSGLFFYGRYDSTGEDHGFEQIQSTDSAPIRTLTVTGSWVYTPNSSVVNEARFSYNRITFNFVNIDVNTPASAYGLNTGVTNPQAGGLPSIVITGFGNGGTPVVGTAFNRPQYFSPNPYWVLQDAISVLKGKHSVKFGGEFTHIEADAAVFNNGRGRFDFFGSALNGTGPFTTTSPSTPLEDFFAGALTNGELLSGNPNSNLRAYNFAGFIQDDWRISPRVILNIGLRYNYMTPFKDANGNLGNFDPSSPTGLVQQGQPGFRTVYKGDPHQFEPRFGMAWDVGGNGKTVVRVGAGLMHETFHLSEFELQFGMQGDGSTSLSAVPTGATFNCGITAKVSTITCPSSGGGAITLGSATIAPSALCWDAAVPQGCGSTALAAGQSTIFPVGSGISCGDAVGTAPSPCDLMSVDPNLAVPYVVNYNVGVTRAFGNNMSLEVEYVGNHGYNLLSFTDINQAPTGSAYCLNSLTAAQKADACAGGALGIGAGSSTAMQEARPFFTRFPYLGYIYQAGNLAHSNYNSLQTTFTKRMSGGLSFTAGYTYGHGLDNGSLNRFGLNPQNSNDINSEYASSDFDVRNRFTATATYNIPGKKGFGQLLEGWQLNGLVTLASSQPWQIFDPSDDFSGTLQNADRWDFYGSPGDFGSGKSSIPYCNGFTDSVDPTTHLPLPNGAGGANATCGVATPYNTGSTFAQGFSSSAGVASCVAHANANGSAATLAAAGCYVGRNGSASVMLPPALGSFGNMGRNIFRDSGYRSWDVSLFKNFTFKERFGIQARWEVFNVLNHPTAANPYGASSFVNTGNSPGPGLPFGASFLTPDFAAGNPLVGSGSERVMQVGLKLSF